MAEKATTKAPIKAEVTEKSLVEQLAAKRVDLHEAKKSLAAGELVNPRVISALRKDIARLLTNINAQKEAK